MENKLKYFVFGIMLANVGITVIKYTFYEVNYPALFWSIAALFWANAAIFKE